MPNLKISFNDLLKELEKHRSIACKDFILSKEQKKFLLKAREGNHKVSWDNILMLWQKAGWPKISRNTAIRLYNNATSK